jgi:hypothetical protein
MTALSTLVTWGIAFVVLLPLLIIRGDGPEVIRIWVGFRQEYGALKADLLLVLTPIGMMSLTWLMMIRGLWVCLTGRPSVAIGVTLLVSCLLAIPFALGWLFDIYPKDYLRSFEVLTWLAGPAALGKLAATALLARIWHRRQLVTTRMLALALAGWLLCVVSLFVLSVWLIPEDMAPRFLLGLASLLVLPLPSLLAAPLALTWNRHR